ncbi:MAG: SpoIIE family protein phosphatase [Thermodesulfobacteriota bacterium]
MELSFEDLRESNEFLRAVLDNLDVAVLLADENFCIQQFNDNFLKLFRTPAADLCGKRFGGATGCAHAIMENRPCGQTAQCDSCAVRKSLAQTLLENRPVDGLPLERIFYLDGSPVQKYLRISTRNVSFQGRKMVMLLLYDVTDLTLQKMELVEKQRALDLDLSAAARIQESLLPPPCRAIGSAPVAWKFDPCTQVGGDIFNVAFPTEEHAVLYMLDVAGHGVSAALVTVAVSQFLHGIYGGVMGGGAPARPRDVVNSLEKAFPFERFDSFFSIVYGVVDLSRRTLTCSVAGHPPPLLLQPDGVIRSFATHGPVVGLGTGIPFQDAEIALSPGEKIILYTDGVVENRDVQGTSFGRDRLVAELSGQADKSVWDLAESLAASHKAHLGGAPPDDDVSLLIFGLPH